MIGQYVVQEILGAGHDVTVFDRVPPPAKEGVRWVRGDIEDLGEVISALRGAEAVVHLAAFTMPYRDVPDHVLFRGNLLGTYNVHEAAFTLPTAACGLDQQRRRGGLDLSNARVAATVPTRG